MRSVIFVRSYWRDFPWLHYCLRSIRKFCTGFDVKVVVQDERAELLRNVDADICTYHAPPGKGMVAAMNVALDADIICPNAEYIFFVDSDCIFTKSVIPEDYFRDGKVILPVVSFANLRESEDAGERRRAELWQPATEAALGWTPEYSTMCRIPVVHHRDVFEKTRFAITDHVHQSVKHYLLSLPNEFPWRFSEFEALGAVAMGWSSLYRTEECEPRIVGVGAGGPYSAKFQNVNCYWSHGGISLPIRAEMEGILA